MKTSIVRAGLFALVCLAAGALGYAIVVPTDGIGVPAFWPLSGVLVGALLVGHPRRDIARASIAAGAMMLASTLLDRPAGVSALLALLFAVQGVVAARVLRRVCGTFSLTTLAHVWALVCVSAVIPLVGGVVAGGLLGAGGASLPEAWRSWWFMNGLGMLLVVPIVVAVVRERTAFELSNRYRALEMMALSTLSVSFAVIIFSGQRGPFLSAPSYLLPFFLWSVFRFGVGGTAATFPLLALIGLWNAAQGNGPFALPEATPQLWILRTQGTIFITGSSLLLMAAAVAERRRTARENEMLVADLQKALAEIKTLEGFIPICAWCHKVRDDAGFWQQIESYLDERTDATFSHSICPVCTEQAHLDIAEHQHVS